MTTIGSDPLIGGFFGTPLGGFIIGCVGTLILAWLFAALGIVETGGDGSYRRNDNGETEAKQKSGADDGGPFDCF